MMFIHKIACISPQQTFSNVALDFLNESIDNKLKVIEPSYESIPANILRRMGKAVKVTVGAALPLLENSDPVNGIIIGTANGGMEDCIKFMNQIMQYNEGMLTPGNFVQSTPNGLAAQVGLLKKNNGYNITHVHRGLSFENAVVDAVMMLNDFPENTYLLGAADEISSYNYNVDYLGGWYKKEIVSNKQLYNTNSPASIAGEGAVMMLVNAKKKGALAHLKAIYTLHSEDKTHITQELKMFLTKHLGEASPDILITGENGDNRFLAYYEAAEKLIGQTTTIIRFKHMSGEYPTASSQALWLALHILQTGSFPLHAVKQKSENTSFKNIVIYNNYKGAQHSFMLVSLPD